jgi:hypothetical protein
MLPILAYLHQLFSADLQARALRRNEKNGDKPGAHARIQLWHGMRCEECQGDGVACKSVKKNL